MYDTESTPSGFPLRFPDESKSTEMSRYLFRNTRQKSQRVSFPLEIKTERRTLILRCFRFYPAASICKQIFQQYSSTAEAPCRKRQIRKPNNKIREFLLKSGNPNFFTRCENRSYCSYCPPSRTHFPLVLSVIGILDDVILDEDDHNDDGVVDNDDVKVGKLPWDSCRMKGPQE